MICHHCGRSSTAWSAFCTNCGQPQPAQATFAAAVGGVHPVGEPFNESIRFTSSEAATRSMDSTPYASFSKRFVAFVVDQFIAGALAAVTYFILAAMAAASGASAMRGRYAGSYRTGAGLGAGFLLLILGAFLAVAVYFYYFVRQETGPRQATLGKSLFGMRITTASGLRISVGQSLGRLVIKDTLSGLFFALGFLIAAFTQRKQALHDFLAGTIVVQS